MVRYLGECKKSPKKQIKLMLMSRRSDRLPLVGSWQLGMSPIGFADPVGRWSRRCLGSELALDRPEYSCMPGSVLGE